MWSLTSLIDLLKRELQQDAASDDVTTRLLMERGDVRLRALVKSRESGVFAGEPVVRAFSALLKDEIEVVSVLADGARIEPGQTVVEWQATASVCLRIERTLLNALSHASGIATLTRKFVDKVSGTPTKILATRKTLPGLREFQLSSVVAGGGHIHRRSLSDGVLIKENHQALEAGDVLVRRAKETRSPLHGVEIEVQSLKELEAALSAGPDVIMLDNFSVSDAGIAVKRIQGQCRIEVSGGINLETIRPYAELGVDYISVGQLTHSARALDLGLDLERV